LRTDVAELVSATLPIGPLRPRPRGGASVGFVGDCDRENLHSLHIADRDSAAHAGAAACSLLKIDGDEFALAPRVLRGGQFAAAKIMRHATFRHYVEKVTRHGCRVSVLAAITQLSEARKLKCSEPQSSREFTSTRSAA